MPSPVPNKPTVDFPSPAIIVDTLLIERSSSFIGTYKPVEPGAPFSNPEHSVQQASDYAGTFSLGQKAGQDNEFQERYWHKPPATQDVDNYDVSYSGNATAFPIFKRIYLETRDGYSARTVGSAFTGLYAVQVTAGGAGYTNPTITFTGGGGTGAIAIAILDPNTGAIVKITVKSEGSGFTGLETVVISGDAGSGASATVRVQPAACVLVDEAATNNAKAPFNALYLSVARTYETLPGPWIYSTKLDEDSEVVTVAKRRNIAANITSGESVSGGTLTKTTMQAVDGFVAEEIVETRALPGNILTDYDQEPETQALITTTFQMVANPVSAPTATPGQIVKVKHIDDYYSWLITETRSTPAGWTEQENGAFHFPTLFNYHGYSYTDACGAFCDSRAGFSCNVQLLVEISFSTTIVGFVGLQLIPKSLQLGKYVQFSDILVDSGSFVYSGSCTGTVSFGASSPSYSAYSGAIGSSQLIGGSSKKTKYGDYRTEQIFVTLI
jgi:hypothetical protein